MFYTRKKEEEVQQRLNAIETEVLGIANSIGTIPNNPLSAIPEARQPLKRNSQNSKSHKSDDEKLRAAYALNLCTVSISQIIQYNDLKFMEHEYEVILNNLNLEEFPKDEALLNILKQILDVVSFFRIQEGDRAMLNKEYQMKMKNAIWSAIPNFSLFLGGGLVSMIVSLAMQVETGYMNYRKQVASINIEHEKEEWKLQRSAMEQLHGLQRELFDTAWRLADEYAFPDEYRLTERQINRFNEILTDTDNLRKYERLLTIKNHFAAYPPFLYYLGNAANAVYQQTGIEEYKREACTYYEDYITLIRKHSLLREDQLVASCALEYCELIPAEDTRRKEALLDDAIKHSGEALDVVQLCALEYLKNKKSFSKAVDLLKMLVNEQYNTDVNAKLLSRLYVQAVIENNKPKDYMKLYEKLAERTQGILLFPMPEKKSANIETLSAAYLQALKDDLLSSYKTTLGRIISRYESRYNMICNEKSHDISLQIAELLQELLKVVQEFLNLYDTNVFATTLRDDLSEENYGTKAYAMWTDRKYRTNPAKTVGFCELCSNAFKSLCSIIVDRVASCKSISEISYFDVNLSLFCDKHNLYSFDSFAAPLIENESIADIILGKSYEARRQHEEIIKKCVDKIRSMENEIIIDNTHQSKYNIPDSAKLKTLQ